MTESCGMNASCFPTSCCADAGRNAMLTPDFALVKYALTLAGVPTKTLQCWEAGRAEPLLSEAKRLAKALNITLDDLSWDQDTDDSWLKSVQERVEARALAFRAREAKEGELLNPGARLVWEVVGRLAEEREAVRLREAAHRPSGPVRKAVEL